jgi:hypothetical protein
MSDSLHTVILPRNGMTFAEFRKAKPGILPDTILYNGSVAMLEKLYQVEAQWIFNFTEGLLSRISFMDHLPIFSPASFQAWIGSVKMVIEDFSRTLGRPATHVQGEARYFDLTRPDFANPAQRRHVFHEATWSIAGTEVRIIAEIKSNRADDERETYSEDDREYWNYDFQIDIQSHTTPGANAPMIYGRFYLGMPVDALAARIPALFPQGTAPSGQWIHNEEWQGLQGEWNYIFATGKLVQFQYNAYFINEQISETSFQTCKKAALAIIEDFKRRYGKPNEANESGDQFKMPNLKINTFYYIVTAQWNAVDGMRILVEFTRFHGGVGYDCFSINVQATDKIYAGL